MIRFLPTESFEDVYIGRTACEWIEQTDHDEYPWYMFVSFVGPHDPYDPPTEYGKMYRDRDMPDPITDALTGKPDWHRKTRSRH